MIDNRFKSLRFPDEVIARDFVLAAHGGDAYETYEKLREKYGCEPDWEELAMNLAFLHELVSQPLRKKARK
jgi:hypothetical protein